MPRYLVTVSRVEYKEAKVEVEADNEEAAEQEALQSVGDADWELENAEDDVLSVDELPEQEEEEDFA